MMQSLASPTATKVRVMQLYMSNMGSLAAAYPACNLNLENAQMTARKAGVGWVGGVGWVLDGLKSGSARDMASVFVNTASM